MNKLFCYFLVLFAATFLFSQEKFEFDKYKSPQQCLSCHKDQANDWATTWHSRSHYDSNALYKKTVDYVSSVTYESVDSTLIKCGQCHNPKMTIKQIYDEESYALSQVFNIASKESQQIKESVVDENLKGGISCVICHTVDKIHQSTDLKMRGFEAVEWNKNNAILGPYGDENRAGYHKSEQRDHFVNSNELCMVCHYGGVNDKNVKIYATGEEYAHSNDTTKCADCHMSSYTKGIIAPQITRTNQKAKIRDLRSHLFAGARNSDILKDTFDISLSSTYKDLIVNIKNITPHKAPTGFGDRSIDITVSFMDNDNAIIEIKKYILEAVFVDKRGKETISYVAHSLKSDTRLNAYEQKKFAFPMPAIAKSAKVELNYRLINERMAKLIKIDDPVFTKNYPIYSETIKLK